MIEIYSKLCSGIHELWVGIIFLFFSTYFSFMRHINTGSLISSLHFPALGEYSDGYIGRENDFWCWSKEERWAYQCRLTLRTCKIFIDTCLFMEQRACQFFDKAFRKLYFKFNRINSILNVAWANLLCDSSNQMAWRILFRCKCKLCDILIEFQKPPFTLSITLFTTHVLMEPKRMMTTFGASLVGR